MMGAMLISSLIIFPALTSMRIFKSFRGVVLSSGVLGVVCFCIGMVMSYRFSTPAGASVVVVNLAAFLLFTVVQWALHLRTGGKKEELKSPAGVSKNTEAERQQQ